MIGTRYRRPTRQAGMAALSLIAALLVASPARATDLAEALAKTYVGNPTLEAARAELRAIDEEVPNALSGWRPTIAGEASGGKQWINERTKLALDKELEPRGFGVTLSQPLFSGFGTVAETSSAENQVLAGRASLRETEQQVFLQAVGAYMQVVRDQSVLELQRNNEAVIAAQLQAARDRFDAGEVTRTDVAQAESRLQGAIAARIAAEGRRATSAAAYTQVIGDAPVDLAMPDMALALPASREQAVEESREAPIVLAARHGADAAKDDIDVAFSQMLPSLSIEGSWRRQEEVGSELQDSDTGEIMGVLRVPLYSAGAPDAQVRQSKALYQQSRRKIDAAMRAAEQAAIAAWLALETAEAQIASFEEQVRASEIALEGVKQEQMVGARTVLDVLNAELEALNAKVNRIGAQTDLVVARYRLLAAVGRLNAADLGLAVTLYDPVQHYEDVRGKFFGTGASVE